MEHETGQVSVEDIEQRLRTTQEDLDATERALAAIPERKEALLGAAHFDDEALAKVEVKEASLIRKMEYLKKRIPLLEKQREEAEAYHAQVRISELPAECAAAREQYDALWGVVTHAREALQQALAKLVDGELILRNCHDEQQYYLERFASFSLQPAILSESGEWPDLEQLAQDLVRATSRRAMHLANNPQTEWGRRVYELIEERHRALQGQRTEEYQIEWRTRRNMA